MQQNTVIYDSAINLYNIFFLLKENCQQILNIVTYTDNFKKLYEQQYINKLSNNLNNIKKPKFNIRINIINNNINYQLLCYDTDNYLDDIYVTTIRLYCELHITKLKKRIISEFNNYINNYIEKRLSILSKYNDNEMIDFNYSNNILNTLKNNITYELSDNNTILNIIFNLDNSENPSKTVSLNKVNDILCTVNKNRMALDYNNYYQYNISFFLLRDNNLMALEFFTFSFMNQFTENYFEILKKLMNFLNECKLYALLNYPNSSEYDFINNLIQIISFKINYINSNKTDKAISRKLSILNYNTEKFKTVNIYI